MCVCTYDNYDDDVYKWTVSVLSIQVNARRPFSANCLAAAVSERIQGYDIYIYIYNYKLTYTHTPHTHTRRRLCPYARSDPRSTVQRFVVKSIFGRGEELYSSVYHAMSVAFTNVTFPILFHLTQEIIRGIHNKYLFINIFFNWLLYDYLSIQKIFFVYIIKHGNILTYYIIMLQ